MNTTTTRLGERLRDLQARSARTDAEAAASLGELLDAGHALGGPVHRLRRCGGMKRQLINAAALLLVVLTVAVERLALLARFALHLLAEPPPAPENAY